ncbi:hypothetical protein MKW94_026852, partial [Papaver nudicaule]|nr:hypothetical protein [Papaver nudicaule]
KMLGVQLKNCVANEKLIKIKASFKLSDASKKTVKSAVPKTKSVKSVPAATADEKTKKRKKPTKATKSTAAVAVPKSKSTIKKSEAPKEEESTNLLEINLISAQGLKPPSSTNIGKCFQTSHT